MAYPSFLPLFGCFLCLWLLTSCQGFISCEQHYSKLRLNQELFTTSKNTESYQKTEQQAVDTFIQAKPSKQLGSRELHDKYLPELEVHLLEQNRKLSVNASKWAIGIRLGRTKFLAEYATRLQRLGLLTEKSIRRLQSPEGVLSPKELHEKYLLELEIHHQDRNQKLSVNASIWASKIRRGRTKILAEYATRLQQLGLLTEETIQTNVTDNIHFESRNHRHILPEGVKQSSPTTSFEKYLLELEDHLQDRKQKPSKNAWRWAGRIRHGQNKYSSEYATRLRRLFLLTEKSIQRDIIENRPNLPKEVKRLSPKELHEKYLPELEVHHLDNTKKPSKAASIWANRIRCGQTKILSEYFTRLQQLGLFTEKSIQNRQSPEGRLTPAKRFKKYLLELELHHQDRNQKLSVNASIWASKIRRGRTKILAEYATRLQQLGLLSEETIQTNVTDNIHFESRNHRHKLPEGVKQSSPTTSFEKYLLELEDHHQDGKRMASKNAWRWAGRIRHGRIKYSAEYATRLQRLFLLTEKSIQRDIIENRPNLPKEVKRLSPKELHEKYLPELEVHHLDNTKKPSKAASIWANRIRRRQTKILSEYFTRLQQLGLFTEKSIQRRQSPEGVFTLKKLHEKYLLELEIHYQDENQKLSVNASIWASKIRRGRTKILAEYATRLHQLGLLSEETIQTNVTDNIDFESRNHRHKLPEGVKQSSPTTSFEKHLLELEDHHQDGKRMPSENALKWASGIRHGQNKYSSEYATRLRRLFLLTEKSIQRDIIENRPNLPKEVKRLSPKELHENFLRELEVHHLDNTKKPSKAASIWANRIRCGQTKILSEYFTRLQQLGLLTEKSIQRRQSPEGVFTLKKLDEKYLLELEIHYQDGNQKLSVNASIWASKIRRGRTKILAEYATRLHQLGLLSEETIQKNVTDNIDFESRNHRHILPEGVKQLSPTKRFEKHLLELEDHLQDRKQKPSENAWKWASGIRHGQIKYSSEYATRLRRLFLLTEKSIQRDIIENRRKLPIGIKRLTPKELHEKYLPELEAHRQEQNQKLSKNASNWASGIRHGRIKFLAEYATRFQQLGLLTDKSIQVLKNGEYLVAFETAEVYSTSRRKPFEERCKMYLPELEAYYAIHGELRYTSKEISKGASQWASGIKEGKCMFLAEYAPRLERLGLLSTKSRQRLRNGDSPVAFEPSLTVSPKSFEVSCEMNLPELEAYYEKNGSLFGMSSRISKQAFVWANSIKHGSYLFEASHAPRLERIGLLTRKSRQCLREGEVPFSFTPAAVRSSV